MTHRPTEAQPVRRLVLAGEAADILGISRDTLLRLTDEGTIPCIRYGRGQRRYDEAWLRTYREESTQAGCAS